MKTSVQTRHEQSFFELDEEFHVASRNDYSKRIEKRAHLVHYQPETLKLYEDIERDDEQVGLVELDHPYSGFDDALFRKIAMRRSDREFGVRTIDAQQVGRVCYLAAGARRLTSGEAGDVGRTTPSAGGLCSVDIYVLAMNVAGLQRGIYRYHSGRHGLVPVKRGDFTALVRDDAMFQVEFSRAAVLLILVSSVVRLKAKYGLRGYRLALLDAGYVSQNIYLASSICGLATCASAGFIDDVLNSLLNLDGLGQTVLLVHGLE